MLDALTIRTGNTEWSRMRSSVKTACGSLWRTSRKVRSNLKTVSFFFRGLSSWKKYIRMFVGKTCRSNLTKGLGSLQECLRVSGSTRARVLNFHENLLD